MPDSLPANGEMLKDATIMGEAIGRGEPADWSGFEAKLAALSLVELIRLHDSAAGGVPGELVARALAHRLLILGSPVSHAGRLYVPSWDGRDDVYGVECFGLPIRTAEEVDAQR